MASLERPAEQGICVERSQPLCGGTAMIAVQADRRLAAILAADVVGYSALMERDEDRTLARLKAHRREFIEPLIVLPRLLRLRCCRDLV